MTCITDGFAMHIYHVERVNISSSCKSLRCNNVILFVADLLRNIRTQVLIKLIKPYTRIHIPFISKVS